MASEVTQRQRAEGEVEKLLQFIEATSGRKLRFRSICNLNTGKQESPSERLAGWYEKIVTTARQEALKEACKLVNDYNCMHNHGKKATKACDDIFEKLDRLAREGREG